VRLLDWEEISFVRPKHWRGEDIPVAACYDLGVRTLGVRKPEESGAFINSRLGGSFGLEIGEQISTVLPSVHTLASDVA
jgi:hypothetical protein